MPETQVPLNLYKLTQPLTAEMVENRRLTPEVRGVDGDVRHITFRYKEKFHYLPGQSVGVIPEGSDHKLRLYSVASVSAGDFGDHQTVSLCVVRHFWSNSQTGEKHIPGIGSNYLCDLTHGHKVHLTGPVGRHFLLPDDFQDRDLIFMATGTGIAPYRGMLKEMFEKNYRGKAWLFFGVKFRDMLLYDQEFESYRSHRNFLYCPAVSREEANPVPDKVPTRENRMYVQSRMYVEKEALKAALKNPKTMIFICGLKGMEQGIYPVLEMIGKELGEADSFLARLKAEHRLKVEVY